MYVPAHFAEPSTPVLHELIRAHPFATLVTSGGSGLTADHLPLELVEGGELGVLRGHVARGNPLWRSQHTEAMAVFRGPDCYISPSYYATKRETGKVVPTWNYAVVHAHGPLRVIEDAAWLRQLIERLTDRHEAERPAGTERWRVGDAPDDFIAGLVKAIVGIELPIARLDGKWKVSQNRPAADRAGVADGLECDGGPARVAMAALVRARG